MNEYHHLIDLMTANFSDINTEQFRYTIHDEVVPFAEYINNAQVFENNFTVCRLRKNNPNNT